MQQRAAEEFSWRSRAAGRHRRTLFVLSHARHYVCADGRISSRGENTFNALGSYMIPNAILNLCILYGQDIGATALSYLCWALWHLGYVDKAAEVAAEAMKRAQALAHPFTLLTPFVMRAA